VPEKEKLSSWQIDVKGLASACKANHSVLVAYRELQKAAEYVMRETGESGLVPSHSLCCPSVVPRLHGVGREAVVGLEIDNLTESVTVNRRNLGKGPLEVILEPSKPRFSAKALLSLQVRALLMPM
jgi:hypothetical protein